MRICMIVSISMPPREGIGFYVWNLSHYLIEKGHQVQIITRSQDRKPFHEVQDGIFIWRPQFYPIYPLHVSLHGFFVQHLVNRLEAEIDVFHLHSPLPPAIHSKRAVMLTLHSMMVPDARARKLEGFYDLLIKLQAPVSYLLERQVARKSQAINAVSPPVAEQAYVQFPEQKDSIPVMWNGVDTSFFFPDESVQVNPDALLYVGRLAPGKGLHDLILAFKTVVNHFPNACLTIAGDGPQMGMVRSLMEQQGLKDKVRLLGHVHSREDLRALYRQAWALILPSHHESLPGVVLESMACGTPVIATRVGGLPTFLQDGQNGLIVAPRALDELTEAIIQLIANTALRNRLGHASRQTVEERFSWQVIGENFIQGYQTIQTGAIS